MQQAQESMAERARTDTWGTERDRRTIAQFARGITDMSLFKVCAIEVLRADRMLEFVAVHGNPEAAEVLLGEARPYDRMAPVYRSGETYGDITFIAREWRTPEERELLEEFGFLPSFETIDAPDAWQVDDMIVALLCDDEGRLRAVLHLDEPQDGRRPRPDDLRQLSERLQPAFSAVLMTVEREELVERVRYAELTRTLIRQTTDTMGIDEFLAVASAKLRDGFEAERLTIYLRDAHGFQLRLGRGHEINDALYESLGDSVERAWRSSRVVVIDADGVWGDDVLAQKHGVELVRVLEEGGIGSLALVPIGAAGTCLGSLVVIRGRAAPRWSNSETDAVRDVGLDLGRAVLNARAHDKEHQLATELRRLDEYRSELIATVSHELKNPIGVIAGHLEMVEQTGGLPADLLHSFTAIKRGTHRLETLADDLLLLSRIGNPNNVPVMEKVDVDELLAECAEFARLGAERAEVTIVVEPSRGQVVVHGDRTELSQVVTNLLSNAVKYSDPGGEVRLAARRQGRWVNITCADSGLGISSDDQKLLFTEFFRSTNAQALTRPGTGLGLTILKRVVERHGGQVSVASELGEGTTFRVTVPAHRDLASLG